MLLRACQCVTPDVRAPLSDAKRANRDPTGTAALRRAMGSASETRWRRVMTAIRQAVSQDVLGLNPASTTAFGSGDRVQAFQTWIDNLMEKVVLEDGAWLRPIVARSYVQAVARAQRLTRSAAAPADLDDVINGLHRMAVVEVQGVIEAVSQRLVRDAGNAILTGGKPSVVARLLTEGVQKTGVTRTRAVIEVMVSKAFTHGTLDTFKAANVRSVGVLPESVKSRGPSRDRAYFHDARRMKVSGPGSRLKGAPSESTLRRIRKARAKIEALGEVDVITAEDDLVCPECEDISLMGPYTVDEAFTLIPAHPWCRCAFVPGDEFDTGDAALFCDEVFSE